MLTGIASSTATGRLVGSAVVGVIVGSLVGLLSNPFLALLCGVDAMAAVFVAVGVAILWPMSSEMTRDHGQREDFKPALEELVVIGSAVASIIGIIVLLVLTQDTTRHVAAALGLVGVFLSWGMLHLMYAARYAHLYYSEPAGGIDFNTDQDPNYRDFCYFSYNLGMTYQVSDTSVSTTKLRTVIARHCLLSYLFGTIILAATINLAAGIVTS